MTEAYKAGFYKGAESHGISAQLLFKVAGLDQVMKTGKRGWQLLTGGKPLRKYHKLQDSIKLGLKDKDMNILAHQALSKLILYGKALRGDMGKYTADELRKVLAVRLGLMTAKDLAFGAGTLALTNK